MDEMDEYEQQQARLGREFLSIKIMGQPLISLSVHGVWILGVCLTVCVLAWVMGPKNIYNVGDRFNLGFWIFIAYLTLVRSVILKFGSRMAKKDGDLKQTFHFSSFIAGGVLFFVWAATLSMPWIDIVPNGSPAMIFLATIWIFLAYLHSHWFWVRSSNSEEEME